jgi:competence protein ComEC
MAKATLVFAGGLSFLIGIFLVDLGVPLLFLAVPVLLVAAGIALFDQAVRLRAAFLVALAAVLIGFWYAPFYRHLVAERLRVDFGAAASYSGTVVDEPDVRESFQRFTVRLDPPHHGTIMVGTLPGVAVRYGDVITVTGRVEDNNGPELWMPKQFTVTGENRGNRLRAYLIGVKHSIIGVYRSLLPSDTAALLGGLTFGVRGDFTADDKASMSLSGTTHLVALSGYNISILVIAVANLFRWWLPRRATFVVTIGIISLFVLMVGAEASVVRAAVMGVLALVAREAGRRYYFRNSVTLAAAAMALADPTIVTGSLGFQLSFASLLGLVYLEPLVGRLVRIDSRGESVLGWRESLATTLAAQLAVAPLLIEYFGSFSLTSLAANVLVLTTVPIAMLLGFLLGVLGLVLAPLAAMLAWLVQALLVYQLSVIRFFAAIRIPVPLPVGHWTLIAAYYGTLVLLTVALTRSRAQPIAASRYSIAADGTLKK